MRPETRNFKNIQEVLNLAKRQAKLPQFERLTWVGALRWLFTHKAEIPSDCHIFINSIANVSLDPDCVNELIRKYPDLLKRVVMEITEGEAISSSDMEFKWRPSAGPEARSHWMTSEADTAVRERS